MIDEAFDTALEDRLRAALAEMIPKLVASPALVAEGTLEGSVDVVVAPRAAPVGRSRRIVVAALAVAATLLGLIVIAQRYNDRTTSSSPATDSTPPPWYDTIAPLLPERFPYVSLTLATDVQLWFVAIGPSDGKTLEIQLASQGYSAGPTTSIDATGQWSASAQGWSVRTPAGLFVSVTCDIGVGGRDFVGPTNYCDMASGVVPYTMAEIRALTNTLATSLSLSIFDEKLGRPQGDTIDTAKATELISTAVPGQISATDLGNGSDHIYNAGAGVVTNIASSSDTFPPLDSVPPPADTSVRILHGVYPTSLVNSGAAAAAYDDAAVVWMFGSGGIVVRISTTDSSPQSVTRLQQLARDLMKLDPVASKSDPTATAPPGATTTTTEFAVTPDAAATSTTTTIPACGSSATMATVLVVNASHVVDTAKWWRDELAANVPSVDFAEPVNAVAQEPTSRVLALAGYECEAGLVAGFTAASTVEQATIDELQAMVAGPLPAGTSIMVLVGDDNMSKFTTGVTTTISP